VSTTASALVKWLWSLKSAVTNMGKRRDSLPTRCGVSVSGSSFHPASPHPVLFSCVRSGGAVLGAV
jgi:hypothetical protein